MLKLTLLLLLFPLVSFGQYTAGTNTFQFLNASSSARNAGAGNGLISVYDNDLGLALEAYNHGPTRLKRYLKKGYRPKIYSQKVFKKYKQK